MQKVDIDSKDDKEEKIDEEEKCDCSEETEEKAEKSYDDESPEDKTEEESQEESDEENKDKAKDKFNYRVYGKETAEEARTMAEKMFNDVYSTLKSRQSEWNKTFEEYRANKPAIDLLEYEDKLVIKADLPRVTKDDISIQMSTESVEIEVDFTDELTEEKDAKVLRKERCSGKTKSIIPLPVEVDLKEVKASFENNELVITLPKVRGKKVDVEIV